MTTESDQPEDSPPATTAPYLPPSTPTATGSTVSGDVETTVLPAGDSDPADAPFVPAPAPVQIAPPEPVEFDAKAMVESQKRVNANPAYGSMPSGSEASREAAKQLRNEAKRKRQRNKRLGWFVGLLFFGGVGVAAWYGYQSYQDEQAKAGSGVLAEPGADELIDDLERDPAALTPVGGQAEVNRAQDALNDTVRSGAGAGLDAIDDAREIVGEGSASEIAGSLTLADIVPPVVVEVGERVPDLSGRETYVIDADAFATDPAALSRFLRALSTQPQVAPGALLAEGLPEPGPNQYVISVDSDGDTLRRALVIGGTNLGLAVDYQP